MASSATVAQEITDHLASKNLHPTPAWLTNYVASVRPNTPLNASKQTALFRLLASDIRQTLQQSPSSNFPTDVSNASIKDRKLAGPIPVQLLDIEDIGRSRWSQVEELESAERGETTKGREIIRVVPGEDGSSARDEQSRSVGPHKLTLQDARGTTVYGIELLNVPGIDVGMNIGAKLLLQGVTIARGVALLEPNSIKVLGGKIDALHKSWKESRKETLKTAAGTENQG